MHKDLHRLEQRLDAMVKHIDHAWKPKQFNTVELPPPGHRNGRMPSGFLPDGVNGSDSSLGRLSYRIMQVLRRIGLSITWKS
jgi:hypothetical protein